MSISRFIEQLDDIIEESRSLRHNLLQYQAAIGDEDLETSEPVNSIDVNDEPHPMDFMFEGTDNEPADNEFVGDPVETVIGVILEVLGETQVKMDDQGFKRVYENCKGDRDRIRAAVLVLQNVMETSTVRSPGGLLIKLSGAHNILEQARALENKSPEQVYSDATRAAKKKMDEKIQAQKLRGNAPNTTRAGRFKGLAEGVGTSSGAQQPT